MSHFKFEYNSYISHMMFKVVEGIHKNPNDKNSIIKDSMKEYGPFKNKNKASELVKLLMLKNVDDFYHRAWLIPTGIKK